MPLYMNHDEVLNEHSPPMPLFCLALHLTCSLADCVPNASLNSRVSMYYGITVW